MKFKEIVKSVYELRKKNSTAAYVFHRWAEATTAHGFLDLSRAKTLYGKVIWVVLIAVSWIFMCYQVSRVVSDFAKHEWTSGIKEKLADPEVGVLFPSIVVCNANRLKWSKAQEYGLTLEMIEFIFGSLGGSLDSDTVIDPSTPDAFAKWRKEKNMSYFDMFDAVGPKCEDIFIGMCDKNISIVPINTYEYGRCYFLNANKSALLVGAKDNVQLLLDTQGWDYVPIARNNYIYEGLLLQLTYSQGIELGQWIQLYPATYSSIGMQLTETGVRQEARSYLNPFSLLVSSPPCTFNPESTFSNASAYSPSTCLYECALLQLVSVCQCMPFTRSERFPTCEIDELYACTIRLQNETADPESHCEYCCFSDGEGIILSCKQNCSEPCNFKYVETQISMSTLPSANQRQDFENMLAGMQRPNSRVEDIIMIELFFTILSTKFIERYEAMSLDNMISSSGGLIGLWAGMSFLTVFQAIAFLIEYVEIVRKKHKTNEKEAESDCAQSTPTLRRQSD